MDTSLVLYSNFEYYSFLGLSEVGVVYKMIVFHIIYFCGKRDIFSYLLWSVLM